ncbi:Calcium sensing receptor, chloroplastic [Linum grandiflorum]
MALRSPVAAKLTLSAPSSSPSTSTSSSSKLHFSKTQLRRPPISSSVSLPASTTISLLTLFASAPFEARALSSKDQIASYLTEVDKTIDQVVDVGSVAFGTAASIFSSVSDAVKPAIEFAVPIAKQAGEQAVKIASPVASELSRKAQEVIQSSGVDTQPVVSAAKIVAGVAQESGKVIEGAKPIASSTFDTILTSDPIVLAIAVEVGFFVYFLLPPVWSVLSFFLRGYQGDLTAAQALDLISTKNHVLIDIRSEKDKDKAGIPRLPSNAKNKMVSIPLEELPNKLKGLVKNTKKLEAELAALKISYLKRVNKGSNIIILDSYADSAKTVARTLTSLGFKNCWVVGGGFSGGRGWLQSRLGTDSYNVSFAEIISPSRIIPAATKRFGTSSKQLQKKSHSKLLSFCPLPNRSARLITVVKCAWDSPYDYQGNTQKFPRMKVWDPYKRLGVSPYAAEEEVWDARNFLREQYAGDESSEESIEAAFEKLLMTSFKQRKKTKINLKTKLKKQVDESPAWVKNLLGLVEMPPMEIVFRRLFLFAFMGGWSIMNSADGGPAFQVAVSLAACIYFLNEKTKSLGRAFIIGLGALATGWICGSVVVPMVPTFLIHPTWTLELMTSLVAYFFLFLGCTFLK